MVKSSPGVSPKPRFGPNLDLTELLPWPAGARVNPQGGDTQITNLTRSSIFIYVLGAALFAAEAVEGELRRN